jgi:hypothetical protein
MATVMVMAKKKMTGKNWCNRRKTYPSDQQKYLTDSLFVWIKWAMHVKCTTDARSCNHCFSARAETITYAECVCSLTYPACNAHASYCHLWPDRHYKIFFILLHKRQNFRKKKVIEYKICVPIFSTTCAWNIYNSRMKLTRYDRKYLLALTWSNRYSCQILMKLEFSQQTFWETIQYQISWKSVPWKPSCCMRTYRRTDMTKPIVAFRSFVKESKNHTKQLNTLRVQKVQFKTQVQ